MGTGRCWALVEGAALADSEASLRGDQYLVLACEEGVGFDVLAASQLDLEA